MRTTISGSFAIKWSSVTALTAPAVSLSVMIRIAVGTSTADRGASPMARNPRVVVRQHLAVFVAGNLGYGRRWAFASGVHTCRVIGLPDVGDDAEPEGELVAPRRPRHGEVQLAGPLAREVRVAAAVEVGVPRFQVLQLHVVDHA